MIASKGGASKSPDMLLPGKAGGALGVRRILPSTICRIIDPTQVARLRQLRDASPVMPFRPAHQSMINRRFDDPPALLEGAQKRRLQKSLGNARLHLETADMRVDRLPVPIEWLSDKGSPYTAHKTRAFAGEIGFVPRTTPIESPSQTEWPKPLSKPSSAITRASPFGPMRPVSCASSISGSTLQ